MTMKRSEIASEVQYNLGNVSGLAARTNVWMNWSLEDIASVVNWRDMYVPDKFMLNTEADKLEYAVHISPVHYRGDILQPE